MACCRRSWGGGSYQSKEARSPPQANTSSTAPARSILWTSGSRCGRRRSLSSQRRRAVPGPVRPARPARCAAESAEMRSVSRRSIPFSGSKRRTLCRPESTTSVTPSIVSEVSARLVARMTFRRSRLRESRVLLAGVEASVERQHHGRQAGRRGQVAGRLAYLARSRQEAEDVPAGRGEPVADDSRDALPGSKANRDVMGPAHDLVNRASVEIRRDPCRLGPERRGHHHHGQVGASRERLLDEGQGQVGVDACARGTRRG